MQVKEDFLHYIWKYKLFNTFNLTTSTDEMIEVVNFGLHNTDAGPDFFNAKVKVGNTLWVGNIEIHVRSSDWLKHQHQKDKAFDNVILHVVYINDEDIIDKNGNSIPTLELKGLINPELIKKHNNLIGHFSSGIACGGQIKNVDEFTVNNWLNRLAIERLERKSIEIKETLKSNQNDWEQTFFQYLFKYFGLKVNAQPFELLARNTALKIIEKHNAVKYVEALLFGQAGFLEEDITDVYFNQLKKEYQFLKSKFQLTPLEKSVWKMLRLRPNNFPTIRIAQLSSLLSNNSRLFAETMASSTVKELQDLFKIQASVYWNNHYQFGVEAENEKIKKVGIATINSIIINVVVPFTFVYGKATQQQVLVEKALKLLEEINAENNTIIKSWSALGVKSSNAMQTQALIELKNNYCSQKKCLICSIGNKILQT